MASAQDFVITSAPLHERGTLWGVFECRLSHRKLSCRISGEWPCEPGCIVPGMAFRAKLSEFSYNGKREFKFAKGDVHSQEPRLFATCQILLDTLGRKFRPPIKLLADAFGSSLPDRLCDTELSCRGISKARMAEITKCFHENGVREHVDVLLRYPMLPAEWARHVQPRLACFVANPYLLYDLVLRAERPRSLAVCDQISQSLPGLEAHVRHDAYVKHSLLTVHQSSGGFYFERESVVAKAHALAPDLCADSLCTSCESVLVENGGLVTLPHVQSLEVNLAMRLCTFMRRNYGRGAIHTTNEAGGKLDPEQRLAVANALSEPISVVCGKAGTGKTFTISSVLEALHEAGLKVLLCAPTGKAAQRMREAVGAKYEAYTVHSILSRGAPPKTTPPQRFGLIVDESSMLSVKLCNELMALVEDDARFQRLVFAGDPNQLPSIDPGALLRDLVATSCVPTTELKRVHRQGEGSAIVANAHKLLVGEPLCNIEGEFALISTENPVDDALAHAQAMLPQRAQFIVQTNATRHMANKWLQELYNPGAALQSGVRYRVGDPVISLANVYDDTSKPIRMRISNGSLGKVVAMTSRSDGKTALTVIFDEETLMFTADSDNIDLAYATTLHKFQGSEAETVVFVLDNVPRFQSKQVAYTAFTRARRSIRAFGTAEAIAAALSNDEPAMRHTLLSQRLDALHAQQTCSRFFNPS
mgnify:CR=1 FL=1|tara:strand:- start:24 stop:2129 length:2106 start_codon:yes stop_codon:yes gene_type:complete